MGNKACAMPWCHKVGDFKVKTSRFRHMFQDDCGLLTTVEEHLQSKRALLHGDFQCVN